MFEDANVSIDTLEQALLEAERVISQARAYQVAAIRLLDRSQVARADGARSLNDWVAAKLDVGHDTARDLCRASKVLAQAPEVDIALSAGNISFDRALATGKLAAAGASQDTIDASRGFDLTGVTRLAARHRRVTHKHEHDAVRDRHVAFQPRLDGLSFRFFGELPAGDYTVFEKALTQRSDELPSAPDGHREPRSARMADALVSIAQDSLDGVDGGRPSTPLVTVFVDAALAGPSNGEAEVEIAAGPRIGPSMLDELLCTGKVQAIELHEGRPVVATDATSAIPPAIRRAVLFRDGGCTIDGCTSTYRLQPHHIVRRADGGDHDPDRLTTLCWYHHHVVIHGRGYRLDPESPPQRRRLLPPVRGPDPPEG